MLYLENIIFIFQAERLAKAVNATENAVKEKHLRNILFNITQFGSRNFHIVHQTD